MKYLFLFLMLIGCAHTPKYKINDCVHIMAMIVDKNGEWHSSGKALGEFKILDIVKSTKQNKWMADRLHSNHLYILKDLDWDTTTRIKDNLILPVEDLDKFRYASVFWETPLNNTLNCNTYGVD